MAKDMTLREWQCQSCNEINQGPGTLEEKCKKCGK